MRWIMADYIDEFEPWSRIAGRKAVSFEEAYLLERFGMPGFMPDTILIETMAHVCRWCAMASSEFEKSAILTGIDSMRVDERPGMGDVLNLSAQIVTRNADEMICDSIARVKDRQVAAGRMSFGLVPLAELMSPEEARALWRNIPGGT